MYENYSIGTPEGYQPQAAPEPPKPPRKKQGAAKVIALIAAVAVIGGGAGFGGAYVASKVGGMTAPSYSAPGNSGGSSDKGADTPLGGGPSLEEMQSSVSISHNVTGPTEFNSDGTFAYTRDLISAVKDTVVDIEVYVSYRGDETLYSGGSGIVISSDGYIITNAHVVDGGSSYKVHISETDRTDGSSTVKEYRARLVGSDTDTDLAVLKVDAEGLQAAVLGNSDELHVGDDVVAMGYPLWLEVSATKGIVSGLNRTSSNNRSLSSIQFDAAVNSGNSGGPLFNMYGEVVGVVNKKMVMNNAENIGFAITINEAKSVIDDLVSRGFVGGRPILGIECLQVSEYVAAIQNMTPGLLVTAIKEDMAIADSELVVGDTITKINGISVTAVSDASEIIKDLKPGDSVTVTVVRTDSLGKDKEVEFDIILSEYNGS